MTTIQTIHQYRCDLNKGPCEVTIKVPIMHQDALGDVFRVAVWRGSTLLDLSGMSVRGYMYFASTRQTLLVEGSIVDGCASVALTSECYAIPGYASLAVQVQDGNIRHSVLKVNMCITRTGSEIVIAPGDILPTLPELLGQIAAMEQATEEANATMEAVKADTAAAIATIKADTAAAIKATNEATAATQTATVELAKTAAPPITPTVSGALATITDGAERPAVSLITRIEPVQTGSGDPSPDNKRPISGWNTASVQSAGKNLLQVTAQSTTINGITFAVDNGVVTVNGAFDGDTYFYLGKEITLPAGTYTMSGTPAGMDDKTQCAVYDDNFSLTVESTTTLSKQAVVSPYIVIKHGFVANNVVFKPQIEVGSVATAFEPYQGQILSADLPETVYGGTFNWNTGVLTVTWECRDMGVLNWNYSDMFYASVGKKVGLTNVLCSHYATKEKAYWNLANGEIAGYTSNDSVYVKDTTYTDTASFKAAMSGKMLCFEFANPYTIQLTPQQLNTLKGTNNVWSDTGDTELTYIADIELYINKRLAAIAAASL